MEISENEKSEKDATATELALDDFELNTISSAEMIRETLLIEDDNSKIVPFNADAPQLSLAEEIALEKGVFAEEEDPIFAELAAPKLPALPKEDRARLQMQSPTRLYFYWSFKRNPFQILNRAFAGKTGNYRLVVKLVNRKTENEEIFPIEAEGSWWFNVDADSSYRAEIGFYAPNRPFVRTMFSNTVETPRRAPSPHRAQSNDWAVSANQFAQVLDVSGFTQDAFEVALAGDDFERAETATHNAFSQFIGSAEKNFLSDEVRFALLALASGYALEHLRGQIGASLFAVLQDNAEKLSAENALASLQENFDVFSDETLEEEFIGDTVFGASLVNFPKSIRKRTAPKILSPKGRPQLFRKLSPVSSFALK